MITGGPPRFGSSAVGLQASAVNRRFHRQEEGREEQAGSEQDTRYTLGRLPAVPRDTPDQLQLPQRTRGARHVRQPRDGLSGS